MTLEDKISEEEKLLSGEIAPMDRLQNQIHLAKEMYELLIEKIDLKKFHDDIDYRNSIMFFWSKGGESSFSSVYRRLENSEWFKTHEELKGNIFEIKPKHIFDFIDFEKQQK